MRKLLVSAIALGLALVSMLPGVAAARLAGNHNQTSLRVRNLLVAALAVGLALTAMLPGQTNEAPDLATGGMSALDVIFASLDLRSISNDRGKLRQPSRDVAVREASEDQDRKSVV